MNFDIKPLSPETWNDFEELFGPKGAYGGCWCMWWRLTKSKFDKNQGAGNRQALRELVDQGKPTGLIAYIDDQPMGWCSVAPREDYGSLERSRILKRIDNKQVWSIVCFFINKQHRGKRLGLSLIKGAIQYVSDQGGKILEAYPTVVRGKELPPVSSFMGIPKIFEEAGFKEEARPSEAKMIMRYNIS